MPRYGPSFKAYCGCDNLKIFQEVCRDFVDNNVFWGKKLNVPNSESLMCQLNRRTNCLLFQALTCMRKKVYYLPGYHGFQ